MDPLGRYQPSNAERLHAAKLFKLAEALLHSDRGYLTEWQLSAFLQLSGVPAAELDAVWGLSVPSGSQTMAQAEFAVAMRLVAMAQAGQPVAWHALEAQAAQALPPPAFTGASGSRAEAAMAPRRGRCCRACLLLCTFLAGVCGSAALTAHLVAPDSLSPVATALRERSVAAASAACEAALPHLPAPCDAPCASLACSRPSRSSLPLPLPLPLRLWPAGCPAEQMERSADSRRPRRPSPQVLSATYRRRHRGRGLQRAAVQRRGRLWRRRTGRRGGRGGGRRGGRRRRRGGRRAPGQLRSSGTRARMPRVGGGSLLGRLLLGRLLAPLSLRSLRGYARRLPRRRLARRVRTLPAS